MGCRQSKPVAVATEDDPTPLRSSTDSASTPTNNTGSTNDNTENTVTMVSLASSSSSPPSSDETKKDAPANGTSHPPLTTRKSSITQLFFGSGTVNQSNVEDGPVSNGSLPALLPSQRESTRSLMTPELRTEVNRRASIADLLLSKYVVKAIDAATTELSLHQPPDAVGINFPQLIEFPDRIFRLTGLLSLSLKNNKLEKLPPEFGQKLALLQSLDLSENQLTVVPDCICDCTQLQSLDISENMIIALPSSVQKLTALKTLIAFKNNLTALPEELSSCTALETVNVFNNKILRISPSFGTAWINLKEFNAGSNKLKNFPPIPGWTKVTRIALQWNGIVETPDFTPAEESIVQIQLNDNALSAFPLVGQAKNLTLLDVSSNMITEISGTVLQPLVALETLTLRKNKLQSLPDEFYSLPKLTVCDLQDNELTSLSSRISGLKDTLVTLLVSKNKFTMVPENLRDLNVIQRINLETNIGLDLKNDTVRNILWDVRDKCIANGGWLRTSGTALGSRPKPTKTDDEPSVTVATTTDGQETVPTAAEDVPTA